ncbi:MAG: rod shape-determining protein RodA, partial [Phycisphaerales bacterium]|nr:rod shape-determining protein RodA [Phycisphaerales bacterium]
WIVLFASLALTLVGVYAINLTSGVEGGGISGYALKQIVLMTVALVAGACVAFPHYRWINYFAWPAAWVCVGLLIFLLIPFVPDVIVTPRNGARRWINLLVTDLQPSEVTKVVFVLVTARYLQYRSNYRTYRGLILPAAIAFVPMALILVEPDLGTALIFMPVLVAMLIAAGAKIHHLVLIGTAGALFAGAVVGLSLVFAQQDQYPLLRPHQVERIEAVIDQFQGDERHQSDRGFQGKQAITLFGSGGVAGHGEGRARALIAFSALPERHNDMIFAVLGNRFGFTGAVVVVGLYCVWIGGAFVVSVRCRDPFGRLIVVGLATIVGTQMVINMGMTMGLLPITGMTLPFVSYGGSSLVVGYMMVGLVMSVAMRRPPRLWRDSFEWDA